MTVWTNSAEGGTNAATVTTGNSGGASGTAFTTVTSTAPSSVTFDNTHARDTLAIKVDGQSSGEASFRWSVNTGQPALGCRIEMYLPAYSGAGIQHMDLIQVNSLTTIFQIYLNHLGNVKFVGGGVNVTSTNVVPLSTWFRIEFTLKTTNTGAYDIQLFPDTTTTTPTETLSGTPSWPSPANLNTLILGMQSVLETKSYWLDNIEANDTGTLPGPYVPPPIEIAVPVADLTVDTPVPTVVSPTTVFVPVADLTVDTPAPALTHPVPVPIADLTVDTPTPTLRIGRAVLVQPADAGTVPAVRPRFAVRVALQTPNPAAQVRVTVLDPDDDPVTTVTASAIATNNTAVTALRADLDLTPEVTYQWFAEVHDGTDWGEPTATRTFTVDPTIGTAAGDGSWTVDLGATPAGHVWFVRPASGIPGDRIAVYGLGLGPSSAQVVIAGVDALDPDFTAVDAVDAPPEIDPLGSVTVEHDRVDATVPDIPAPGGQLYVIGS